MKKEAATAVAVRDLIRTREREDEPPQLEPVGQCPYCHEGLEKKEVRRPFELTDVASARSVRPVIFAFWACQNPHCALMFWRLPHALTPRGVDTDFDRH